MEEINKKLGAPSELLVDINNQVYYADGDPLDGRDFEEKESVSDFPADPNGNWIYVEIDKSSDCSILGIGKGFSLDNFEEEVQYQYEDKESMPEKFPTIYYRTPGEDAVEYSDSYTSEWRASESMFATWDFHLPEDTGHWTLIFRVEDKELISVTYETQML